MENQARENQVKLAEELLGVRFPAAYRANLLKSIAGTIKSDLSAWKVFTLPGDAARGQEGCLYRDLIAGNEDARRWDSFPAGAIAIARNDCGDLLVLLPAGEGSEELSDCVHYWWHAPGEVFTLSGTVESIRFIDEGSIWRGNHDSMAQQAKNRELLSEMHVDVAEFILKVKFPAIYTELLLSDKCRGYGSLWSLYPDINLPALTDDEEIDEDDDYGLELTLFIEKLTYKALKEWKEPLEDGLVIAENKLGDLLVLMPSDPNSEGVLEFEERLYIFDHSDSELYIFADTLEEFMEYYNFEQEA